MELSEAQRAALTAVVERHVGIAYARASRPSTKMAYRAQRTRLKALRDAWAAIDHDTQMHLLVAVRLMWEDDRDDAPVPDLYHAIGDLLDGMELSAHRPEELPGLNEVVLLLWSNWCAEQPPGEVPIGQAAQQAIGAEVAVLFGVPADDARRRVNTVLRGLDQQLRLPNREGYAPETLPVSP
ncbi:hypothetical protein [Sphingomonas sp. M1A8_2b]